MAHQPADPPRGGTAITRRTLFGLALTAVIASTVVAGAGAAHAYSGGGGDEEDYEIPDDLGSAPWW